VYLAWAIMKSQLPLYPIIAYYVHPRNKRLRVYPFNERPLRVRRPLDRQRTISIDKPRQRKPLHAFSARLSPISIVSKRRTSCCPPKPKKTNRKRRGLKDFLRRFDLMMKKMKFVVKPIVLPTLQQQFAVEEGSALPISTPEMNAEIDATKKFIVIEISSDDEDAPPQPNRKAHIDVRLILLLCFAFFILLFLYVFFCFVLVCFFAS
jgi:hypothetical protein